ncbi:tyrosine-type recombinase/integrase [Arthrobacter nitrophenolicus]|uniref:tyrosine-type recombinase/integrase n=1 Tax=Arthrobacter nitrophenolicus TaxID=683150 RepID=UPI001F0D354B|nr:hypothetical protein [Arthrobacter nitrophenolicus]
MDANRQSFEIAQHSILSTEKRVPTVAEVVQEYIDLLIRPSSGTTKTYQTMLDLHIRNIIGHVPVDKLDYRLIAHWVKSMMAKGKAPKTIHNVHGLISAAMNTAEMLGYIPRNPCRGVQLPGIEKGEDEAMFLAHAEFNLIMEGMGERYKAFTRFLVMTGTRIGEATAPTVTDVHTHASWLIQDGVPLFTISRRRGHVSTRTTEQVYGHLMAEALQAGADATERSITTFQR